MDKDIFSKNERLVITIIGKKKMTIGEITDIFCDSKQDDGDRVERQNYIAGVVRRIIRKCNVSSEVDWILEKEGSGSGGTTVWKEAK